MSYAKLGQSWRAINELLSVSCAHVTYRDPSEIELLQPMRLQFLDWKVTMIQIQEFGNAAPAGLACLKCGFEAADFDRFCHHVELCEIPV